MAKHLILKLLILSTMAAFSLAGCPVGGHIPLGIAETHLSANQNELLKGLLEFDSSLQKDQRDLIVKTKYIEEFSPNKFTIRGNATNQSIELVVNNVNLQVTGQAQISQAKNRLQLLTRNIDILLNFDKIAFKAKLIKAEDGTVKVDLLDVSLHLNSQANKKLVRYLSAAWSEQDIQSLLQNLTVIIEDHLYGMVNWNAHKWIDVIPYGQQLLGGAAYLLLGSLGLPEVGTHSLLYCLPQFGLEQSSYFKALEKLPGDKHRAEIILNQDDLNAYLAKLHQSERQYELPLTRDIIDGALEQLRDKFGPFRNAHSFGARVFLSEDIFNNYWDEDDYPRSKITLSHDGNITVLQNVGIYVPIYDSDMNIMQTLTVLMKVNAKIQVQDQKSWNYSKNKRRPALAVHHFMVPSVVIYNEDGDVLNMESMMALIGITNAIQEKLKSFNADYEDALSQAQLLSYLGDIFMDGPKDFIGFHWIRLHVEGEEKKSISFVIDFEQEQMVLDPQRYESAYKYGFKWKLDLARGRIHDPNLKIRDGSCNKLVFQAFEPFLEQWCLEEIEGQNITDKVEASKRCMKGLCEIMYDFFAEKQISSFDLFEFKGMIFGTRKIARFTVQVIVSLFAIIVIRLFSKKKEKSE